MSPVYQPPASLTGTGGDDLSRHTVPVAAMAATGASAASEHEAADVLIAHEPGQRLAHVLRVDDHRLAGEVLGLE